VQKEEYVEDTALLEQEEAYQETPHSVDKKVVEDNANGEMWTKN